MKLQHPYTCIIAGPSGCGKTTLVKQLIDLNAIEPRPDKIMWCYAEDQPLYRSLKHRVEFIQGVPEDLESRFQARNNNLLILDDLMTELHSDERLTRLFSVGSHHRNLSVIFIVHNLFHQGREMRTLSLNSHYIVLCKNPRDQQQITHLARQMYPGNSHFLVESFFDATKKPHGYLLLDLKPTTEELLRVRTNILPTDTQIVYVNKQDVNTEKSFVL